MNLKELADYLCERLITEGFIVQRYDAYKTDSIYLKLDFGVCNSIRIADHPGKRYLKYRYNIGSFVKKYRYENKRGLPRLYFRQDQADALIEQALRDRESKLKRYGADRYQRFMEENKAKNSQNKGFWQKSWIVGKGGKYENHQSHGQ